MANKKNKNGNRVDYEAMFQECVNDFTDKNTFLLLQILAELKKFNCEELPTY